MPSTLPAVSPSPTYITESDGILMELFLDVEEYGAEANGESGQGPPRSCGVLEGACIVWKEGGSASPLGRW